MMVNSLVQLIDALPESLGELESLTPNFTSNLVLELAFRKPNCYIIPYGNIIHERVNLSYCDVKSAQSP